MFPEDFFGTQNQFITIQTQSQLSNREHPKLINPLLIKRHEPQINEIKEEIIEESIDVSKNMSKNKIPLRIVVTHDSSIDDVSTSGGSNNTPISPMTPIIPEIQTNIKENNFTFGIKGKPISNNIHSSFNENTDNKNITEDKKDLCLPLAFTFSHKFNEKQNQTLKTGRNNQNSFREKSFQDIKRKSTSCQKSKEDKNIINAQRTQRINSQKKYIQKESNKNNDYLCKKNNKSFGDKKKENSCLKKTKKNIRSNSNSSYDNRKLKSAKKNKEINNIITFKNIYNNNNKAIIRRNNSSDKKELVNKNNDKKCFFSVYMNKKKDIVHSKIKKEINNIFNNLPENYEKFPELNNKLELFMKNIDDIKDVLIKKKSQDILLKNKTNKEN